MNNTPSYNKAYYALQSAIKRLETIKETFPAISVDSDIKIYRDAMDVLKISAPVGVPDGYKLVPIEPTEEMGFAGAVVVSKRRRGAPTRYFIANAYKAMLSAAPTPEQTEIDLEAIKLETYKANGWCPSEPDAEIDDDVYSVINSAINHLASQYDFVRKV